MDKTYKNLILLGAVLSGLALNAKYPKITDILKELQVKPDEVEAKVDAAKKEIENLRKPRKSNIEFYREEKK